MSFKEFWAKVKFYSKYIFFILGFIVTAIVGAVLMVNRENGIFESFNKQTEAMRKQHEKELLEIQNAKNAEIAAHRSTEANYRKLLSDIEKDNKALHELIKSEDSKKIKEILQETQGDPIKTAERFSTLFGIPVEL